MKPVQERPNLRSRSVMYGNSGFPISLRRSSAISDTTRRVPENPDNVTDSEERMIITSQTPRVVYALQTVSRIYYILCWF